MIRSSLILNFTSPLMLNPIHSLKSANTAFSQHKVGVPPFFRLTKLFSSYSISPNGGDEGPRRDSVQPLRIPTHWMDPSRAAEESKWLRVNLQKWLDDEYCPEATNIEISRIAADSYYRSLVEGSADLGEILLKMAVELESISYQESFHGAFSSANAAVSLIVDRVMLLE
ncbi:uncharacterized protein LOC127260007 [Andrographis paniculata]|uniref:uncharacterized protein LOC127260007 n=1 Tax=Andrographis paniculata TaxID=175694 RepID=UPI0021E73C0E|nr:uncharacterized protein LOC127260007 [Andrographis paniculata]